MFGKRGASDELTRAAPPRGAAAAAVPTQKPAATSPKPAAPKPAASAPATPPPQPAAAAPASNRVNLAPTPSAPATIAVDNRSDDYYQVKTTIFSALLDTIDLAQLAQLDVDSAREEIRDICNDVLGYGPLEPLLARDDIADIMVNGASRVFIEVGGKVQLTNIRFRDNAQLMNICQRIVSQVGRRVDESSPICDARLPDGSRVNVIAPPLALDGPTLTIRKFRKDKLRLDNLVKYGSISLEGARVLAVIGRCRCNIIVS